MIGRLGIHSMNGVGDRTLVLKMGQETKKSNFSLRKGRNFVFHTRKRMSNE